MGERTTLNDVSEPRSLGLLARFDDLRSRGRSPTGESTPRPWVWAVEQKRQACNQYVHTVDTRTQKTGHLEGTAALYV